MPFHTAAERRKGKEGKKGSKGKKEAPAFLKKKKKKTGRKK